MSEWDGWFILICGLIAGLFLAWYFTSLWFLSNPNYSLIVDIDVSCSKYIFASKWATWNPDNLNNSLGCCYPQECPQSKNNPENCNCIYAIMCNTYNSSIWSYTKEVEG